MILVISCSLNPDSSSFILATRSAEVFRDDGAETRLVDLRQHPMPMCDGQTCTNSSVIELTRLIESADAIILAVPIYNFDANAAAKNLVEHTGSVWEGKIVGFLAAAGGHSSYTSIMPLANSLMLDFRCLIVPRFVYAVGHDFADGQISSEKISMRLKQLAAELMRLARALKKS